MKRIKVFVGSPGTGKTKKALDLIEKYGKDKSAIISARCTNPDLFTQPSFIFQSCTPLTQLLIIDDFVQVKKFFGTFIEMIHGVKVHKRGQDSFTIEPDIIITCNKIPKEIGSPAFDHRFSVIQFPEEKELNPLP